MPRISEMMSLKGRTAVITGGAGHIGRQMCETLAELGANVILVDRAGSDFDAIAKAAPTKVRGIACDLEQQAERDALVAELLREPTLNIFINNAAFVGTSGLTGWNAPFDEQTTETWRRAIEVNLTAAFDLLRGVAPVMRRSVGASIINVGSIYGVCAPDYSLYGGTGMGNPGAYAASKGGLVQLTRWLATTLAPQVRVNAISPGGVARGQNEDFVKRYTAKTPLGRMAREDDLAGATAFLASDMSAYVTGQNIMVDGGWSVW